MDYPPSGPMSRLSRDLADRIESIVASAEKEAGELVRAAEAEAANLRADAEAEAREVVRSARAAEAARQQRLAAICDQILARSGHLTGLLDDVRAFSDELRAETEPGDGGRRPAVGTSEPATANALTGAERRELASRLEAARLVAVPMAVAGRSREEVEEHLRSAFDLDDPGPVLDMVFGPLHTGPRARRTTGPQTNALA